jgi:hypothetical protein
MLRAWLQARSISSGVIDDVGEPLMQSASRRAPQDGASVTIRRQRILIIVMAFALVLAVGGVVASTFVASPAERAARVAPPAPTVITAVTQQKVLVQSVTVRGEVVPNGTVIVSAASTKAEGGRIVTGLPLAVGAKVVSGSVIAQISGRPVVAIAGGTPAFRDLTPGTQGTDVKQLQRALVRFGDLDERDVSGVFDHATENATNAFYDRSGYEAPHTWDNDPSELAAVQAARDALVTVQRRLVADQAALAKAKRDSLAAARRQVAYDWEDLRRAEEQSSQLEAASGTAWPFAEIVFVPRLPARIGSLNVSVGDDLATKPSGRLLTLTTGSPVIRSVVPEGSQAGLKAGLTVSVTDDINGSTISAAVTSLGRFTIVPANQAGSGVQRGYPMRVTPTKPLPASWVGKDVEVRVTISRTRKAVLVVPLTAVRTTSGQVSTVIVLEPDDTRTDVEVRPGTVVAGEVEVTPRGPNARALIKGVAVVVG